MRRVVIALIVLACALASGTTAQNASRARLDENLARADAAYRASRFAEAAERYTKLLEHTTEYRGALLLRLGNSQYRAENYGAALFAFERARAFLGDDTTLRHNLARTHAKLGLAPPTDRDPGPFRTPLLVALALVLQSLGLYWALVRRARIGLLVTAAGVACAVVACVRIATNAPLEALVLSARCEVRAEPNDRAATLLSLPTGTRLRIEESSDRWSRVSHPRGSGWVRRSVLGILDGSPGASGRDDG